MSSEGEPSTAAAQLSGAERAAAVDWALYFVTDSAMAGGAHNVPEQVAQAIEGGAHVIQVRDKDIDDAGYRELAASVLSVARSMGDEVGRTITVFANDRVEVARDLGLDIHVGQSDMPPSRVRELMGEHAIIGVSVSNEAQLNAAIAEGIANVVGVGPVWNTNTKTDAEPAVELPGLKRLVAAAHEAGIPAVAIGGIGIKNAGSIAETGADGICVVSAIATADDPALAATFLRREFVMNQP